MTRKPRPGEYSHRSGTEKVFGPDGMVDLPRVRRRFPYAGVVFLVYVLLGPLLCAAVSHLLRISPWERLLPQRYEQISLPPAPSLENVLFGAGLPELALACGLTGFWLWRALWRTRLPPATLAEPGGSLRALLGRGAVIGLGQAPAALLIAAGGLYIRTAPAAQPWLVRPFFALLAAPAVAASALSSELAPLVILALGLLSGVCTALAVHILWRYFPEEPELK